MESLSGSVGLFAEVKINFLANLSCLTKSLRYSHIVSPCNKDK